MSVVTIVPLRSPGLGKTRLAGHLDGSERAGLAGAMLADVVAAIRACGLERILLAASGPGAAAAGAALDLQVVLDPADVASLDEAIEHARITGADGSDILVVQADLPGLTPDDLGAVLAADTAVVVAPTEDGGTSALLRRPGGVMATSYGPDSARRHVEAAGRAGVTVTTVRRQGLLRDVDTGADIALLAEGMVGAATARFLREHGWLPSSR